MITETKPESKTETVIKFITSKEPKIDKILFPLQISSNIYDFRLSIINKDKIEKVIPKQYKAKYALEYHNLNSSRRSLKE